MASLITPLVSGIPAGASGSAVFYVKGTGTLSTKIYSDAAGTIVPANHTLDAYGAVTRYCTEPVDVTVLTAGGATVKTFTFQDDARLVGLESLGFNGALIGGGTGAGGFTTEHAAWGEMFESTGGLDGRVNTGAGPIDIRVAAPGGGGLFFVGNYGAVGGGVVDDTAAIQACVSACALAGGGVLLFAAKVYRITGVITGIEDMLIIGHGATIRQDTAQGGSGWFHNLKSRVTWIGITFTAGAGITTGTMLTHGYGGAVETRATYINCVFYTAGWNGTLVASGGGAPVRFIGCSLRVSGGASAALISGGNDVYFDNCRLRGSDCASLFVGGAVYLTNCDVSVSTAMSLHAGSAGNVIMTGGKLECTHTSGVVLGAGGANGSLTIGGTFIVSNAGGTFTMVAYGAMLFDAGCPVAGRVTVGAPGRSLIADSLVTGETVRGSESFSTTRCSRQYWANAVTGGTFTPDVATYGLFSLNQTSGTTLTIAVPSNVGGVGGTQDVYMKDTSFMLTFKNATGGTIAITIPTGAGAYQTSLCGSPVNVTTGNSCYFVFTSNPAAGATGTNRWICTAFQNGLAAL